MKHKKIVIFSGIMLVALLCSHLFGWSAYIGGERSVALLRQTAEEHLPAAVFLCAQHGRNLIGESPKSALVVGKT